MFYQESQQRILEAEDALRAGDMAGARALFREAAELQRKLVDMQPADRVRTKSIYGLSAAVLFYKAGELDEAEHLACHLLSQPWLEPRSKANLKELVEGIGVERPQAPSLALGSLRST